jgi:hypothetical protein
MSKLVDEIRNDRPLKIHPKLSRGLLKAVYNMLKIFRDSDTPLVDLKELANDENLGLGCRTR